MIQPHRLPSLPAAVSFLLLAPGLQATDQDARIVSAARNSHVFRTQLRHEKIEVSSRQGHVTLMGTVGSESQRSLAEDTVGGLPGVKAVNNQLKVREDAGLDTPDGRLRAKVQSALFFHRHLSASRTQVSVKDGVVTLRGEAESEAQKTLTADYVKDISGVSEVVNHMSVAASPRKAERPLKRRIDDASITAQLKAALLLNRATSALHTKVVTQAGTVTLSGKARSRAERDLCTRIASDIDGVRAVRNLMSLEG